MIVTLIVIAVVVVGVVAYKLHKSGKVVTTGSVVSAVESDVKSAVTEVKSDVTKS